MHELMHRPTIAALPRHPATQWALTKCSGVDLAVAEPPARRLGREIIPIKGWPFSPQAPRHPSSFRSGDNGRASPDQDQAVVDNLVVGPLHHDFRHPMTSLNRVTGGMRESPPSTKTVPQRALSVPRQPPAAVPCSFSSCLEFWSETHGNCFDFRRSEHLL